MTADAPVTLVDAEILDHAEEAPEHYVLTLDAPEIARRVEPGQFVMLRVPGAWDPLFPRAYSVYHADPEAGIIELLYRVAGRGTGRLRWCEPGFSLQVWGPLGNAFSLPDGDRVVLVAGGVGIPPLVFWAERLAALSVPMELVALVGAATERFLVGTRRLREARFLVRHATDDGSAGHPGRVTDLLPRYLQGARARVYACGPMPMLRAVAQITEAAEISAQLALEAPMACGVGACLGCTVPARGGGFLRVCRDGPVFAPERIAW